ncbi:MAG: ABC transporter substrate-binding protein, partial [Clostridia bacterium]|nr:ABC transporter substrate-binding protein [Clostridia bacterium]
MKKLLALMLALLMVFAFCGCGEEAAEENTEVVEENTEVTEEVKVLVMGTNAAFPPYEMVDENGDIIGIDAEIA